jgi:DNA-binding beta-propeller fold protein YncE
MVGNEYDCQSISPNYNLLTLSVSNIATPSLQLYPNPTTGMLQVDNFKEGTLYVYNALGQLIIQQSKSLIDLSKHANGIYHIRAYNQAEELIGIGRVVKE